MHFLKIIDNLLTKEECQKYMNLVNKDSLKIDRGHYGNYCRKDWIDKEFATLLFQRVHPFLPNDNNYISVNPHFRITKYNPGGEFKLHRDTINQDDQFNRSHFTLIVYLNDDFTNGETDFYLDDMKTLRQRVKPIQGRCAIFYSQQYHSGNIVGSGNKFLLITDVMK